MARRRAWRTPLLAILASAAFAWSAIYHFDVAPAEMLDLLWLSLSVVGLAILAAALLLLLRSVFRTRD
jgi:TRAP-type C4-dicarboxylate transport system permease small subunit